MPVVVMLQPLQEGSCFWTVEPLFNRRQQVTMLRVHGPGQLLALLNGKMDHQLRIIAPIHRNDVRVSYGKGDDALPDHFQNFLGLIARNRQPGQIGVGLFQLSQPLLIGSTGIYPERLANEIGNFARCRASSSSHHLLLHFHVGWAKCNFSHSPFCDGKPCSNQIRIASQQSWDHIVKIIGDHT